jgi:hypothetical protein
VVEFFLDQSAHEVLEDARVARVQEQVVEGVTRTVLLGAALDLGQLRQQLILVHFSESTILAKHRNNIEQFPNDEQRFPLVNRKLLTHNLKEHIQHLCKLVN